MSLIDTPPVSDFAAVPGERLLAAAMRSGRDSLELGVEAPVQADQLVTELEAVSRDVDGGLETNGQGLTVSVKEVRVLDEHEGWFQRKGEVYVLTAVIDGSGEQPTFTTKMFSEVRSGDLLSLDEGGMLVGLVSNPRWFVDFHLMVMESDSDIRELGKTITELKDSSGLSDAIKLIGQVGRFDPTGITQVTTAASLVLAGVGAAMKRNGDDHIGTIHNFYLAAQGYGEGRHPAQGPKQWGDAEVSYQIDVTDVERFGDLEPRLSPPPGSQV
jgi:hypothetical protein